MPSKQKHYTVGLQILLTPQDFYQQLSATQQLNPRVKSPVSRISISSPPTEKLDKY